MENQLTKPTYDIVNKDSMLSLSNELAKLIKDKKLSTNIKGKDFVNVEGWQFAGAALGLMPIITETKDLSNEKIIKYSATCEIRNISNGNVVAVGVALCTNAEPTKKYFDEYAILSMSQTRAIGKAYRNLLAWLMKAAGFEATPAEEMDFVVQTVKMNVPSEPENHNFKEVVAEIIEEEPNREALMMEIAKCTKVKQLTDIYFGHKQIFDADQTLMAVLKAKKENLNQK